MDQNSVYEDIVRRTGGNIYIGVVGPVRTGKSTFIKRFMETLVLPHVSDDNVRERARDELPQSASGRTIMTAEPKFVPEEAVALRLAEHFSASVRLIDSVGYMIPGASGQFDESGERMLTTPWFDHEIPMSQAAEEGTRRVITDHSTIGIVVTTDGSITDIPREDYADAERRVIRELQQMNKPFLVLLNSTDPTSAKTRELASSLHEQTGAEIIPVNCKALSESDVSTILQQVLLEFEVQELSFYLPEWMEILPCHNETKQQIFAALQQASESVVRLRDAEQLSQALLASELLSTASVRKLDAASGAAAFYLDCPRSLYYETISKESGVDIRDDSELIAFLSQMRAIKEDYSHIESALNSVRESGYGVVLPREDEMKLEEPEIVRQGGRYGVRLKASGSSIHMIRANVITEVHPELGGEEASGEILGFLLQGFQGDPKQLWESNIFGRPLYDMAKEGLEAKISSMPPKVAGKLQETIQKIINDGGGTLLCIIL